MKAIPSTILEHFVRVQQKKKIILMLVLTFMIVALSAVSVALIIHAQERITNIPSSGEIRAFGVGIYRDRNCDERVTSLDWGVTEPGLATDMTLYVRNEGNAPTILNLNTTNWNPQEASNYITLSWDYSGETVEPNQVVKVTLTLSISISIEGIGTFAFDTTISQS